MTTPATTPEYQDSAVERLLGHVAAQTGLVFRGYDRTRAAQLLTAQAARSGAPTLAAFAEHVAQRGASAIEELAEHLTIKETSFFRSPQQFTMLREAILPDLLARRRAEGTLRLWSAGCATGPEPYSLAMTVREALGPALHHWQVLILATDIDATALETGRRATYSTAQLRGLPEALRRRYVISESANRHHLSQEVREMVTFRPLNLNDPAAWAELPQLDIIFCRNVIIYFDATTNTALMRRFRQALRDDGTLFLGYAETLWEISDQFAPLRGHNTFAYRPAHTDAPAAPRHAPRHPPPKAARERASRPAAPPREPSQPASPAAIQQRLAAAVPTLPAAEARAAALLREARGLADRGDTLGAAQRCDEAVTLDPLLWQAYFLGGLLALAREAWPNASLAFSRLTYLRPQDPLAHYYLAVVKQHLGETQRATVSYRHALALMAPLAADQPLDEISVGLLRHLCTSALTALGQPE
jgi:chemotaxis protein methyltransferase CheR